MTKRILFIFNPHSGTSKRGLNSQLIMENFDAPDWECNVVPTTHAGHAKQMAKDASKNTDIIVAIGGDGTVNEVASAIVDTKVALAIIPRGSGNGLSNFLGIPKGLKQALEVIKRGKTRQIDTMTINNHRFVNIAGVGFDAHIAHLFKDFGTRGFISYSKLVMKEFMKYQGVKLKLGLNGSGFQDEEAFVVSFANSSQYGNNAHIAPQAIIDDGLMDVCIVKKFPLIQSPGLVMKLFNKSLNQSSFYSHNCTSKASIESESQLFGHVDGEPITLGKTATLKTYHQNLKVVIP